MTHAIGKRTQTKKTKTIGIFQKLDYKLIQRHLIPFRFQRVTTLPTKLAKESERV
jgi:hypothetical protein